MSLTARVQRDSPLVAWSAAVWIYLSLRPGGDGGTFFWTSPTGRNLSQGEDNFPSQEKC